MITIKTKEELATFARTNLKETRYPWDPDSLQGTIARINFRILEYIKVRRSLNIRLKKFVKFQEDYKFYTNDRLYCTRFIQKYRDIQQFRRSTKNLRWLVSIGNTDYFISRKLTEQLIADNNMSPNPGNYNKPQTGKYFDAGRITELY